MDISAQLKFSFSSEEESPSSQALLASAQSLGLRIKKCEF